MTNSVMEMATEETLAALQKAATTGFTTQTGAYSYDLIGVVNLMVLHTPFRDTVGREASTDGNPFAVWRAFVDDTASQPRATPGLDVAGAELIFTEQDFQAPYLPISYSSLVTQDAFDLARGLTDPYANASLKNLNQVLIAEDKLLIGGSSVALPQPAALTMSTSTTGGSIATGVTPFLVVAARTGSGYYFGGNSRARAGSITTGAGSTNTVSASIPAVKGAVAYDWFYSANGTTGFLYLGTSTVASWTMTAIPGGGKTSTAALNLPDIATAIPTANVNADNGSQPLDVNGKPSEFNGLIATITADYNPAGGAYVTPGSGTANPAVFVDGGGAALTLGGGTVTQISTIFGYLWNAMKASPSSILVNGVQAQEIATLILASPGAVTYLSMDDAGGRNNLTAGGRVGAVFNTFANVAVPIVVQTSLPPGTIIFRTDTVPFPQSNITSTLKVRTLRDYSQFDYPAARVGGVSGGGPRKEMEIRCIETLINYAPGTFGILTNIQ